MDAPDCCDMFFLANLQHTSLSPDGKLLIIVGDNPDGMMVDSQTGKVLFAFNSVIYICDYLSGALIAKHV